jgi:hypothetical protein
MPNISIKKKYEALASLTSWSKYLSFKNFLMHGGSAISIKEFLSPELLAILLMDMGSLESRGHALVFCSEKVDIKVIIYYLQ